MESEYVKRTVGPALALGMAEVATIRPTDPVEYLAIWLLKHKLNLVEKQLHVTSEDMGLPIEDETESPEVTEDKPLVSLSDETQEETIPHTPAVIPGSRPGSKLSRIMEETEEGDS